MTAEQVRAVLGETTTEWGVKERGIADVQPAESEAEARKWMGVAWSAGDWSLVSRTVTPWVEVHP